MKKLIETLKNPRIKILDMIKDLSVDQLNEVPAGFNNNIIWNMAHMISAQQGLCYLRAGLPIVIADKYFTPYRPGTRPDGLTGASDVEEIKNLFLTTIDQFETDYHNNIFTSYTPLATRYGVELNSINEAMHFLPFHEGFHFSAINSLTRLVTK